MSEAKLEVSPDTKVEATRAVLAKVLALMDFPLRVETKDGEDGGVSVALFPDGEVQGFAPGKRSPVMDALQFFVNKVVNPPSGTRRWVTLGVGSFPPPRSANPPPAAPAPTPAPAAARPVVTAPASNESHGHSRAPADEAALEVAPDPLMDSLGRSLAQKSSKLGRFYAVLGLTTDDRARLLQAGRSVEGLRVLAEGEGRNRRLVFKPDRPAPAPKRLPDDEDEA